MVHASRTLTATSPRVSHRKNEDHDSASEPFSRWQKSSPQGYSHDAFELLEVMPLPLDSIDAIVVSACSSVERHHHGGTEHGGEGTGPGLKPSFAEGEVSVGY